MEDWKKYLPVFMRYFRAFALYPVFLLIWAICMLTMAAFHVKELFVTVTAAIFMPFIFFSVSRVFAEQDDEGNAMLAATGAQGLWARVRAVLCTRVFWIDAGVVLALAALLPFEAGLYHVNAMLFSGLALPRILRSLLLCAVALPLFLCLLLWARLSAWQKYMDDAPVFAQPTAPEKSGPDMVMDTMARGQWAAHSMGASMVVANDSVETISAEGRAWLRRENRKKSFFLQLLWVFGIYAFGGFGLYLFVPVLISFGAILVKIGTLRWWLPAALLLAVIGGFWLFAYLRAFRIRRRLFKNLHTVCREYGFTILKKKRPYASLLRYRDGANLTLCANGKTYDCKLFGATRRHWEMYFHENGTLQIRRAFRFRRVEFFTFTSEYDFGFESEHTKICIVAPVPKTISAGNDRWHRPIDTGTKVGEYRIFSSTGFLNALKRDCIERDK
ncbi:MAG: hypothetical protein E7624_05730 [Ruminococcaceae bacterium]|nr:hypothetical protein [Oscillospiraceae bacterium]